MAQCLALFPPHSEQLVLMPAPMSKGHNRFAKPLDAELPSVSSTNELMAQGTREASMGVWVGGVGAGVNRGRASAHTEHLPRTILLPSPPSSAARLALRHKPASRIRVGGQRPPVPHLS